MRPWPLAVLWLHAAAALASEPAQSEQAAAAPPSGAPAVARGIDAPATMAGGLLQRLRSSLALMHHVAHPRVASQIEWLRRNPEHLASLALPMERYLPAMCGAVWQRRLPGELCLVPIVESGLEPFAMSASGAAGLWQFKPDTAREQGLTIDWWMDERRDPIAATDAALRYLEALQSRLGRWPLAIAAYHIGADALTRATQGAAVDSALDDLPEKAAAYLARIFAYAAVIANPVAHGVRLPRELAHSDALKPWLVAVPITRQMELAQAARAAGLRLDDLYRWNPALNQSATHPGGPHRLLVPRELASAARPALAAAAAFQVAVARNAPELEARGGQTAGEPSTATTSLSGFWR